MRGTANRAIAPNALIAWLAAIVLSGCNAGTPISKALSPTVVDKVALCGGGLKEQISADLRLAVAHDVAGSGSISVAVRKSLETAILSRVPPFDLTYVYQQYTACVTNRSESDQYLATLRSRRSEFAEQLQLRSVPVSLASRLLSLADLEIGLYQAAKFIEARNIRKTMITTLMESMLERPSSRWMMQYTLSEERQRVSPVQHPSPPALTPVQICDRLLGSDPYCRSPLFGHRAENDALIKRAQLAQCAFLVGPEALHCEMEGNSVDNSEPH